MDLNLRLCCSILALSLLLAGGEIYGIPFALSSEDSPTNWRLHESPADLLAALELRECLNRQDGIHADQINPCRQYVVCHNQRVILNGKCPRGSVFDPSILRCTSAWNPFSTDSTCKTALENELMENNAYVLESNKMKYLERNPRLRFLSAVHDMFDPESADGMDSMYEGKAREFIRDARQIKFGSLHQDYENEDELSGSVSKKKAVRQIKFDPLRGQERSQSAIQLPPDFYWRRDF